MSAHDEIGYRLRLAEGYRQEARQDAALRRWRSCVDSSQLAVENAAKTALALVGPVSRTHEPGTLLRQELAAGRYPPKPSGSSRATGRVRRTTRLGHPRSDRLR
jgi:hypothetical protein